MKTDAKHIDDVLWRDLLQCRDILNSAVRQLTTPSVHSHSLFEAEQDTDTTPNGAD
ncbi:MAG TPA: hypothetical protein VHI52_13860 [Verrucomicrobiae bacterium]|nr:hypothetical protein [Verrucomicrobiae bacterium]